MQIQERPPKFHLSGEGLDLLKVSLGKFVNAGLAMSVNIIVARQLGARDFGIFSFSMAVLVVALELCASEGLDNSLVRFGARYQGEHDKDRAEALFKVAFKIKCLLICIVGGGGYLLSGIIATHMLHKPETELAIKFGVIGACSTSLWRYMLAILQTYRRFGKYAVLTIIPNLLKLLTIGVFLLLSHFTLFSTLWVNALTPLSGFFIGALLTTPGFFTTKSDERTIRSELLRFSKWAILSNLTYAIYARMDMFMLGYYVPAETLGIYAVAANLVSGLYLLYSALFTVLLPRVSMLKTHVEFRAYTRRSLMLSGVIVGTVFPVMLFSKPIIVAMFSSQFSESVFVFRILLSGFIFSLIVEPLSLIFYARNKPYVVTGIFLISLGLAFCANLLMISRYGIHGAAFVIFGVKLFGAIVLILCLYYIIFKPQARHLDEHEGLTDG